MTSVERERAVPVEGPAARVRVEKGPPPELPPVPKDLRAELAWSLGEARARAWLDEAATLARGLAARWGLQPRAVLTGGSMSLCLRCTVAVRPGPGGRPAAGRGGEVVLKIPASRSVGRAERAALRCWDGAGAVRLLAEDPRSSAMLMPYLVGTAAGYGVPEVLGLADRLHAAGPAGLAFEPVEANLAARVACATERFTQDADEQNLADLGRAQGLLADLLAAAGPRVLLHGDLQAKNLLVTAAGLTSVDPLPVLGPDVVDVAFWVAKSGHERPLAARVAEVAALRPRWDRDELAAWTWALAVLENRPRVATGRQRRQEYIDALRPRFTTY